LRYFKEYIAVDDIVYHYNEIDWKFNRTACLCNYYGKIFVTYDIEL